MASTSRLAACTLALALLGLPAAGTQPAAARTAAVDDPPNIVIVYIDDVSPHDGRLWSDPELTPTLYDRFVAHGINFPNAIVEDPLCCPARGNLLTGLHTLNNGVNSNHARKFKPSMHIGWALRDAGYDTMYLGKYLNRANLLSAAEWTAHAAGWTHFDVTKGSNGQFYNYTLYTKDSGDLAFTDYHTTRMVAERFVARSRQVPVDKPLFALLSIYNVHAPNTPLPEFATDERCASMPPWNPPNYNEADMSDKPAFQRSRPLLPYPDGWPMVGYCREMLGVDWAVGQVVDELTAQGRLDNTLLIFTGDNGIGWGEHRLGQVKRSPHTTPVPLYMSWPARWGTEPRTVTEHTSNIDFAPTFCDIAGCTLGPFPGGFAGPDGLSLLPVIDGDLPNLGRDALFEIHNDPAHTRIWTALRTTAQHPAGLWHYVEWSTGERELYNLATDPWELDNVAGKPATTSVQAQLATRLAQLRVEGNVQQQPDLQIAHVVGGPYKGNNIYSSVPLKSQTRKYKSARRGVTYSFFVRLQNDGAGADTFRLLGTEDGTTPRMFITYHVGGSDITSQVVAGTYTVASSGPGTIATIEIRIRVGPKAPLGSRKRAFLRATSQSQPDRVDLVRAVVRR